jgi:predicted amidophosphoribosyltransferase
MMKTLATILFLLASSAAMAEGSSAGYGMGGFEGFDEKVAEYNRSGELFRIRGHCQSACTKFLGIRNVCVERSAQLLFHASHDRQRNISQHWTEHTLGHYNTALRDYLVSHHYVDTLAFHTISGSQIIDKFGYRECPKR